MLKSRLRNILLVLSLVAMISTVAGGTYYFLSLQEHELGVVRRQSLARAETVRKQLMAHLSENLKIAKVLAGIGELGKALAFKDDKYIFLANQILDHFQASLGTDVCYLMDTSGMVLASSNREAPDSFVGHNFAFRPYFTGAIEGHAVHYFALGTTSKKRGAYFSYPVLPQEGGNPLGVAVIKASISLMENNLKSETPGDLLLVGPNDVIFCASDPKWLFKTLWRKSESHKDSIERTRQFGTGPWYWTGLKKTGPEQVEDLAGNKFFFFSLPLNGNDKWRVVYLRSIREVRQILLKPLAEVSGFMVLALCLLAAATVFFLNRMARAEILRRETAEHHLKQSEERYRQLYHATPAPLCSFTGQGRIIEVSRYFTEALGYDAADVIGRRFTDFLTPASKRKAETHTLPRILKQGSCNEEALQFIKKGGRYVDMLLSVDKEQNSEDDNIKFLAVLTDVSALKQTEEELRMAQGQLSQYSRELERKVRRRTQEITSFLEYTPAVAYVKDRKGRYVLVNSRWEELFATRRDDAIGRTQHDIFAPEIAEQFRNNDLRVLHTGKPYQAEEKFPVGDEMHSYLSVRFPVLNLNGKVTRLCGISVDITELQKAQDQLRRLSGSIMASQEKERTAIARELHDELGQVLTALGMDAVWLREHTKDTEPKSHERAKRMCELIDHTISEVRHIATRLRPPVLDDLGLVDALEWFTKDFEERTGIACVFTHRNIPEVDGFVSIAAYRVAQEALTNVARHSGASQVDITLSLDGQSLVVEVVDNGTGFDIENLSGTKSLGIAGMRERASLSGGELTIRTSPGSGTEVVMVIPLEHIGEST